MITNSLISPYFPISRKVAISPNQPIRFGSDSQPAADPSPKHQPVSSNRLSMLLNRERFNKPHSYSQKEIDHVLKLAQKKGDFQGLRSTLLQAALQQLSVEITQWEWQFTPKAPKVRKQLAQQAKQIIEELAHRQQARLLAPYLSDSRFRYSILRAMVYHNTPKENYHLSQTLKRPEDLSDNFYMAFRRHDRTLPMYEHLLKFHTKKLEGKNILLVGGGKSPIKEGLTEANVNAHVTNIDKFFPEPDPLNEDLKIGKDFYNPEVNQYLQPNTYDEIWAYYSLPQYADAKEEVKALYQKSIGALRTGGTLRVFPTQMTVKQNRPIRKGEATDYPAYLWLGLNDTQTLSRPYLFQQSEKIMNRLKKRPDLFQLEEFSVAPEDDYRDGTYSRHQTGTNITLLGTPEAAQAYLAKESFAKKLQNTKRLFTIA